MPPSAGSRLGPYDLVSRVGAGGMGEVYRARDHRLERDVAVKIIAPDIAADSSARARFEREARAIARLSHPNIVAIYDVGEQDGQTYAVMELLQGEPLRRRLQKGALPIRKAVEIAVQVARGLAAAHEVGIVHRDLKPENIFVSADGLVKILDFGLAQARRAATPGGSALTRLDGSVVTEPGTVLGTAGYMAPEQVQGLPIDHRCDIFALGAVLLEMLTGKRAFPGDSWLDVMNAVVRSEPDLSASAAIPPSIRRVMLRCLEKQPQDRFSSARDLAFALEAAAEMPFESTGAGRTMGAVRSRRRAALWTAAVLGVLLVAVATGYVATRRSANTSSGSAAVPMRLLLPGPPGNINAWQFSPDGRMVAALVSGESPRGSAEGGSSQFSVWVCDLTSGKWRRVAPANSAIDAFLTPLAWSPDNRFVLFQGFAAGDIELRAADVASSAVRAIARVEATGASWSRESGILLGGRTLRVVPPETGTVQTVLPEDPAVKWRRWPSFLPDGRFFVFTQDGDGERERGVFMGRVGSTQTTRLLPTVSNAVVTASGQLLYADRGTLLSVRLDQERARTEGDPQSVATGLPNFLGYTWFSISAAGALLLPNVGQDVPAELAVLDRTGKRERVLGSRHEYRQIELSPDQRRLAVQVRGQIGVIDVERGVLTPLTSKIVAAQAGQAAPDDFDNPVWRPDGRVLAAAAHVGERFGDLVLVDIGTRRVTTLLRGPSSWPETWSRDGQQLLVVRPETQGAAIWAVPIEKPDAARRLTPEGLFGAGQAQVSPQGDWFAYASDETGTFEIYLQNLDSPGERRRVSADGGGQPRWRSDGRELFYLRLDGMLMAVPVRASMEPGMPVPLFTMRSRPTATLDEYVVLPGGQRFVGIVPLAGDDRTLTLACTEDGCPALVMLTNWPALVAR